MATTINNIPALDPSIVSTGTPNETQTKEIGKDAFLKLLVAQLKNQDPLDPQDQGQFAVDLAQFTQVEQLTEINKKLEQGGSQGGSGLASYLGHQVILNATSVEVNGSNADMLQIEAPSAMSSLTVELLDESGNIVGSKSFSDLEAGKQMIDLEGVDVDSGSYNFRVTGTTTSGAPLALDAKVGGIVSGFIPGPEQTLLVGGREISLTDIAEVHLGK